MRASRRSRPHLSLSLFPFLAVLICTMGVLIVLLVIVVKHADSQAKEIKQVESAAAKQEAEQIEIASDVTETRISLLADLRQEVTKDLRDKQQFRSNIQLQINQLREQAEGLKSRYERMKSLKETKTAESETKQENEVKELEDELVASKSELEQTRDASKEIPTSYALVPYHGKGGTKQRPIFVECTESAVILQPYGIELTPEDFAQPLMAGNPLDASLLTIRDYLHDNGDRSADQTEDEQAYPLLIVRPDGAASYAMVRRAMKSWVDQFGYELIPEETKLSFPKENPSLRREIEKSLKAARIRAAAIRQAANRPEVGLAQIASNQFGSRAGGSGQSTGGGLSADSKRDSNSTARGNASNVSYRNRAGDSYSGTNESTIIKMPVRAGKFEKVRSGEFLQSRGSFVPTPADPSTKNRQTRNTSQSENGGGNYTSNSSKQTDGNLDRDSDSDYAKLQQSYRDGNSDPSSAKPLGDYGSQSETARGSSSPGGFMRSTRPNPVSQTAAGSSYSDGNTRDGNSRNGSSASGTESNGNESNGAESNGTESSGTESNASGSTAGNRSMPDMGQKSQTDGQQVNAEANKKRSSPSLASVRGKDWALPSHTEDATLYRRQILLDCSAGQLRFRKSADGETFGETINFNSKTVRQIDEMIDLVWKRIEAWGMAGVQSYWQPQLMIHVISGGEQRATELRDLLNDSGLDVILIDK